MYFSGPAGSRVKGARKEKIMRKGIALALAVACVSMAQDRKDALRESLKDTAVGAGWFYDDLEAGTAEAKKSGKPMLVVFR